MPTYEYKCDACGHAFEKFQSMSAEPIKVCPACGKEQVRRLIGTGAGLIFKGSGFYITDYRDAGYKDKAKAESGSSDSKKGGADGTGGGESKPAAAAASDASSKPAAKAEPAAASKPASSPSPTPTATSEDK